MGQKTPLKRAVIYCRVSTDDQCCDRQEQDLKVYADKAGYQVMGIYKENASGAKDDRSERKKVLALAQARKIDVILVTELTRWGRSTPDLLSTLELLQTRNVSLIAQTGMEFDLSTPFGKLIATFMAGLATFERDLCRQRIKSGMAAAKGRGRTFGRVKGYIPAKVRAVESEVVELAQQGKSYRAIAAQLKLSKNTVMSIVKRSKVVTTVI
jgi:DNA invertase Pin-like site-specific DNA recombinase